MYKVSYLRPRTILYLESDSLTIRMIMRARQQQKYHMRISYQYTELIESEASQ